jgi:hypothetical protein
MMRLPKSSETSVGGRLDDALKRWSSQTCFFPENLKPCQTLKTPVVTGTVH